jgi:hypothetical protein
MTESHKDDIRKSIYADREALVDLAHDIHSHPEIAYREEYSAARAAEFLERQGFEVERGICGLPTAFQARVGRGRLHLAFCAEYDALPPASMFDRSKPTTELTEVWLEATIETSPCAMPADTTSSQGRRSVLPSACVTWSTSST